MSTEPKARAGSDYRSVVLDEILYDFTPTQAAIIKQLWEASRNGTPAIGQETLVEEAGSAGELVRDIFRSGGRMHVCWGVALIQGPTKGSYQLSAIISAQIREQFLAEHSEAYPEPTE
jgi:hypothetical protein